MIDPLRYRSLKVQLEFDEHDSFVQCWQCLQQNKSTLAFFLCHDCGKADSTRPFCEPCFLDYHARKRAKEHHKPHPIVRGDPVIVQTMAEGDGKTYAKLHDWVTLEYTLTTEGSNTVIEDTFRAKQPLIFQSGCSGPCIHLQILGCTNIAAADILGSSDPYCAVYWKNELVGVTSTKHMTLDPVWANQTFVLPLAEEFLAALDDDSPSAIFKVDSSSPKLKIDVYDWDRLSKNDFLGQACISDADILRILRQARANEALENQVLSFKLFPKQRRGRLGIRIGLRGKRLFVHVVKGENLRNADPHSLSDPYCELFWNGKKAGKTARIDDTLNPEWDLEIFVVKVDTEGPNSIEQSTLRIECLDWDHFGNNDALGQIELQGWQIKNLTEQKAPDGGDGSGEGGEASGDGGGGLGEADVDVIYDFLQKFQKQNEKDSCAGGMVVGVPRETGKIKRSPAKHRHGGLDDGEADEVAAMMVEDEARMVDAPDSPNSENGHGGVDHRLKKGTPKRQHEGNTKHAAQTQKRANEKTEESQEQDIVRKDEAADHACEAPTNHAEQDVELADIEGAGGGQGDAARSDGILPAELTDDGVHKRMGKRRLHGGNDRSATFASDRSPETALQSRNVASVEEQAQETEELPGKGRTTDGIVERNGRYESLLAIDRIDRTGSGNAPVAPAHAEGVGVAHKVEDEARIAGNAVEEYDMLPLSNVNGELEAVAAAGTAAEKEHEIYHAAAGAPRSVREGNDGGCPEAEMSGFASISGDVVDAKTRKKQLTSASNDGMDMAKLPTIVTDGVGDRNVSSSADTAGTPPVTAASRHSVSASPGPSENDDEKTGTPEATTFREATVQGFEEDRGVLVQYADDNSLEWIATKLVPTLQIRDAKPVPRTFLQKIWDKRNTILNLHKHVFNVKRGIKMVLALAMTGSRMQWYPLELTDEQSGANFIRGTVNARLLFHTRGSVLRGLDVAVSHMSLGERARIKVRSDYAFGEVFAASRVPPFSTLIFVAQVAAIGHHDAKSLMLRRALRDAVDDGLFRVIALVSNIVSSLFSLAGRGVALLRTRIKASTKFAPAGDIEDLALARVD